MTSRAFGAAFLLTVHVAATLAGPPEPGLIGRWQYLQPPDREGEVLDFSYSAGRWHGVMNGLERAGEHGLFYYVVAVGNLAVESNGGIRFEIGERAFHSKRPALSRLGGQGGGGFARSRMRFSGRLEGGDLVLRCEDNDGSCPDSILRFKKMPVARKPD
jgi:hypothetical protein